MEQKVLIEKIINLEQQLDNCMMAVGHLHHAVLHIASELKTPIPPYDEHLAKWKVKELYKTNNK